MFAQGGQQFRGEFLSFRLVFCLVQRPCTIEQLGQGLGRIQIILECLDESRGRFRCGADGCVDVDSPDCTVQAIQLAARIVE